MRKKFLEAWERAAKCLELTREDLVALLSSDDEESVAIFQLADEMRARFVGEEIHFRGIIEFSNHCARNCCYCGLRKDNLELARYRMPPWEIIESAGRAAALGCRTIVLQSGEEAYYSGEILAAIVRAIKKDNDVAITLSVGDRSRQDYALFRKAGADRYLLKHETSDPRLFAALRPGTSLEGRLERQRWLAELGYQVGSGNMVGLPGQTLETLADDILLFRRMGIEMAGIGPFIPSGRTPLSGDTGGTMAMTLKALATTRLAMPCAHLPATTSAATIDPQGRVKVLQCGANVIMPNMTPAQYREDYSIYPGKIGLNDTPEESYARAVKDVENVGRHVGVGYGHTRQHKRVV
ncbi:MAG: [FeFe] hydrogenase H-cluster radical SAM maturase HydE [Desulfotomaculaceae bacterium]|nr:[FeFe] hydrogenase H-cluster radical SAM maturase HydE [Desulfotomaculaceae bacterium]